MSNSILPPVVKLHYSSNCKLTAREQQKTRIEGKNTEQTVSRKEKTPPHPNNPNNWSRVKNTKSTKDSNPLGILKSPVLCNNSFPN